MAVRTNAIQTCDRCLKPFNEEHLKAGDEVPVFGRDGLRVIFLSGTSKAAEPTVSEVLSFDDLCPDCLKAVNNLVDRIRLDNPKKKPKPATRRRSKSKSKSEAISGPAVPEYSEAPSPGSGSGAGQEAGCSEADSGSGGDNSVGENSDESDEGAGGSGFGCENGGNLVTDPLTGDVYDSTTGEVVSKGSTGEGEKHPF